MHDYDPDARPEFHVRDPRTGRADVQTDWDKACGLAARLALQQGGLATLDVVTRTADAAYNWNGDDAVEQYRDDPLASALERLEVRVNSVGPVR